jgi:uncharacterized protein
MRLDPRSPLVVDTRDLGRRPGASLRLERTAPAPPDLGSEIIGVPQGSQLRLDLLLEAVMEGVLVSGTVHGVTAGQCVRCLEDVAGTVEVRLQELYAYPERAGATSEDDLLEMQGDLIDLEPALRDAVVPTLPFQPVCRPDCPGLPTRYGPQDDLPSELPDDVDPRWAALVELARAADARAEHQDQTEQYEKKEG